MPILSPWPAGPTPEADSRLAHVDRVDAARKRTVVDVDLAAPPRSMNVQNGDIVRVPPIRPTVDDAIVVRGHVHRPGEFQYRPGLRISDVIPSLEELRPMADQHYVLIRREVPANSPARIHLGRPRAGAGASWQPVPTCRRRRATRSSCSISRRVVIGCCSPDCASCDCRRRVDAPTHPVTISGRVNVPGQYPLERGMRVSDLVRAGGSLNEAAYGGDCRADSQLDRARSGASDRARWRSTLRAPLPAIQRRIWSCGRTTISS